MNLNKNMKIHTLITKKNDSNHIKITVEDYAKRRASRKT